MRWIIPLLLLALAMLPPAIADESGAKIIITEIMPNPSGPDLSGEFIEIMNSGDNACEMLNWTLSDQDGYVDFTFPKISLNPGERAVVYVGKGENHSDNGTYFLYMWKKSSMLNNGGDDVLLSDSHGNAVDYVAYGNGSYVDPPPEGISWDYNLSAEEGLSLERSADTGEWFSGMPTPGERNPDADCTPDIRIVSFYSSARYGDEFVEIKNYGEDTDISGFCISDGEGYLYFPSGTVIRSGESMYITQNYSGFLGEMGFPPNMEYGECYTPSKYPQFANSGDEITLLNPSGRVIQQVSYGENSDIPAPPRGYVCVFEDGWKMERIGRSSFPVFSLRYNGTITLFSSPESSLKAVENEIDRAESEILINVYEFDSQEIAQSILKAMARGVDVKILVEGEPVGGVPDREYSVLNALQSAGADIRLMSGNDRYIFDHAKYMVVDSKTLLIASENFNGDAMPWNGHGNRGWGIVINNNSVAKYMKRVFLQDFNLNFSDISEFNGSDEGDDWSPMPASGDDAIDIKGEFNISIVLGPENGLKQVIDAINSAESSVYVEQFYINYQWNIDGHKVRSPLIGALINASLRGCEVRVLLDGSYYNTDGSFDNDEIVEFLNRYGREKGLNLRARLINLSAHDLVKVHNKGMIIDGKKVMISSFNWGQNSFTNNRELAVFVENRDVASYYTGLFMEDWRSDFTPPVAVIEGNDTLLVNKSYKFHSLSKDDEGISRILWRLDGKNISENTSIELNFSSTGEHILMLTVWDREGNENSTLMNIRVLKDDEMVDSVDENPVYNHSNGGMNEVSGGDDSPTEPNCSDGSEKEEKKPDESGDNYMAYYILMIPAIMIILSAVKISWKD